MSMESPKTNLDLNKPFSLGGCHIDPSSGLVRNGEQESLLQPQSIEVLQYLAHRPGEVISRQEIEEAVWKDRTVGYDALTGTMFKLRKALGTIGSPRGSSKRYRSGATGCWLRPSWPPLKETRRAIEEAASKRRGKAKVV